MDANCNDDVEEDWLFWFPLDITILVDVGRHTSGAGSDQNHHKLDQKRPCGHVHAILAPSLRSAPAVGEHQCTHAGTHEEDCQHWAEHDNPFAVLHGLCQQCPFEASEFL